VEKFFISLRAFLRHTRSGQKHRGNKARLLCELLMLQADLNTGKTACDMLLSPVAQHDFVGFSLTCGTEQETPFRPALRTARPRSRLRKFRGEPELKIL